MTKQIVVCISSSSADRDYADLGQVMMTNDYVTEGSDCQATKNAWCFLTDRAPGEVYDFLVARVVDPEDQLFVGVLKMEPWFSNGKTMDDCEKGRIEWATRRESAKKALI